MTTEVYIHALSGKKREIKEYASTIASMNLASCNSYVMGIDHDEEITFCIQAGMDKEEFAEEWKGFDSSTKRVEIYDHGFICPGIESYKKEEVYASSRKTLLNYLDKLEHINVQYEIMENDSPFKSSRKC